MRHSLSPWRRWLLAGLAAYLLALGCWHEFRPAAAPAEAETAAARPAPAARMRGVSWVGGDSIMDADLEPLVYDHVNWLVQTPFGWQANAAEPLVRRETRRYRGEWGEGDAGLTHTARLARARGIRTLLKPHLWVRGHQSWPGSITMPDSAAWDAWFASYGEFLLHYAALAEAEHLDGLCIGTELEQATRPAHEPAWRDLIRRVRAVYHGPLTYAANWSGEYEQIPFWDALDYVGVQAYFPLSKAENPPLDTLVANWQPHLRALAAFHKRVRKPIIFTEVGYKTTPDAAMRPWEWPRRQASYAPADAALQARCYEALFRACWHQPWLKGLFIWKWYPGLQPDGPARRHADFTPQHKPAEAVLRKWYGQ